ncbi:hypothetical protein FB451DRAFT_1389061 [Mycena latifolia]|nr:hypothetical protein FB451DRAFT_1389061 [Mycena latifolia]
MDEERDRAATRIQQFWRAKRRQQNADFLTTSVRLNDAKVHATLTAAREAAEAGHNTPQARWRRATAFAARLQDGNTMLTQNGVQDRAPSKFLETQHWLELVDGTVMDLTVEFHPSLEFRTKVLTPRTSQGKPRMIRITYLSTEQRLNYLVEIDSQGRLRWARNHELVDTTAARWKDSDGQGIVPDEVSLRQALIRGRSLESTSSQDSAALDTAATHYTGSQRGKYRWTRELRKRFTLHGIVDRLLRKTVKRNTWIYVSDKNFNMFVGIKQTGTFQHSSLLSGGVHFHQFIDVLNERGIDMSKAKISKAEIALWGIEHIKKVQKSQQRLLANGKQGLNDTLHKVGDVANLSSWKREVLEGRRKPPPEDKSRQDVAE